MRSLYRVGAIEELMTQLVKYKIHIEGLLEIRWKGKEVMDLKEFTLFNSENRNNTVGMDFLFSKRVKHMVMDFRPVNERICSLRLRGRFFNITFINCHAPMVEKEATVKDDYYGNLERI